MFTLVLQTWFSLPSYKEMFHRLPSPLFQNKKFFLLGRSSSHLPSWGLHRSTYSCTWAHTLVHLLKGKLGMSSPRIPFRARKVKREAKCCFISTGGDGASGDDGGAAEGCKKKRKPRQEEAEEKSVVSRSTVLVRKPLISEALLVSVTSLSGADAVAVAIEHLKGCDARLRAVIDAAGAELPSFQSCISPFGSLARSIVYQQLATNAGAAIYKRLVHLCGGEISLTPATIAQLSSSELRSVGLSTRKASYLHDLSRNFLEGDLSDAAIVLMEDGKLMSALTAVKGIGVWSVHMFMIFALHRPDVLPVGDLGVRKGFLKLYGLKTLPTPAEMEQLAAPWRPYRSLGAWYMWRLIDTKVPMVISENNG